MEVPQKIKNTSRTTVQYSNKVSVLKRDLRHYSHQQRHSSTLTVRQQVNEETKCVDFQYIMEYYSGFKKTMLSPGTAWMNWEHVMLSEIPHDLICLWKLTLKSTGTQSMPVVARGWLGVEGAQVMTRGHKTSVKQKEYIQGITCTPCDYS